jgi:hypothetical protein
VLEVFGEDDVAEIGEEALAEFEECDAFGAFVEGEGFVPVGEADGAEENGLGAGAEFFGGLGECGFVAVIECGPADVAVFGVQRVTEFFYDVFEDLHAGSDHFDADTIPGQNRQLHFHCACSNSESEPPAKPLSLKHRGAAGNVVGVVGVVRRRLISTPVESAKLNLKRIDKGCCDWGDS